MKTPADLSSGLQRALRTMKDGRPYVLDVEVAPDSIMGDSTWHPNFSIAQLGKRRKTGSWLERKG